MPEVPPTRAELAARARAEIEARVGVAGSPLGGDVSAENRLGAVARNLGNGISKAWEGITGVIPSSDQLGQVFHNVSQKLSGVRVFGDSALSYAGAGLGAVGVGAHAVWDRKTEIVVSGLLGAAAKTTVRGVLAGIGGIPVTAAIGAAGGGASAAAKEYLRQRGSMPESAGVAGIRARLKEEVRNLSRADGRKIANAAMKGAAWGVVGGVIGGEIAENEWVQEQLAKVGGWVGFGGQQAAEIPASPATATPPSTSVPVPAEKPAFSSPTPSESPVPTAPAQPGVTAEAPKPPVVPPAPPSARIMIGGDLPEKLNEWYPTEGPAAVVGTNIDMADEIARAALVSQGLNPDNVSPATFESARLAAQHAMEEQANTSYIKAAQRFAAETGHTPDRLSTLVEGREKFLGNIATEEFHNKAVDKASAGVTRHLSDLSKLSEAVQGVLTSEGITVDLKSGDTVSELLVNKAGLPISWGSQDAPIWGAVIAANQNLFGDKLLQIAGIDLSELPDLVEKAENGDKEALIKLRRVVGIIPNKGKFVIPANMETVGKVMASLKKP